MGMGGRGGGAHGAYPDRLLHVIPTIGRSAQTPPRPEVRTGGAGGIRAKKKPDFSGLGGCWVHSLPVSSHSSLCARVTPQAEAQALAQSAPCVLTNSLYLALLIPFSFVL